MASFVPTAAVPTDTPRPIGVARRRADGTRLTITGVLTTPLGAVEARRGGFIQDASGGIALYLDAPAVELWPAGSTITVAGSVANRYGQRTVRVVEGSIERGPLAELPKALTTIARLAVGPLEGTRIEVRGVIVGRPRPLADGLGVLLDDGSGRVRAVIARDALAGRRVKRGMLAAVVGPLGRRVSSGNGESGHRIQVTQVDDVRFGPAAAPAPPPIVRNRPTTTRTPWPGLTPAPKPAVIEPAVPPRRGGASAGVFQQRVNPAAARVILSVSAIVAFVFGSGDPIKSAGLLGGFTLVAVLVYREMLWPDARQDPSGADSTP
jgi:hypothetical protein